MHKKTLAELVLTGSMILFPQTISNSSCNIDRIYISESEKISPIAEAGLEIYGENPQALGIDFFNFYRIIYSDKHDTLNPTSLDALEVKTQEELLKGKILRTTLEDKYRTLFQKQNYEIIIAKWGKLINGIQKIPKGGYRIKDHEAIDIFTKEGNEVLSPFDGLVVASGDNWEGTFVKKKIATWNKKGLTPKAGNAVILYNPSDKGYLLISHLKEKILVNTGDIVSKGTILGYVGHSGSASIPRHGEHIHVAYKLPDKEGYLRGIDFSNSINK